MPHRITPAQLFALVIIWTAVVYGVVSKGAPTARQVLAESAPHVVCR